jgi:archaellum component FlaC
METFLYVLGSDRVLQVAIGLIVLIAIYGFLELWVRKSRVTKALSELRNDLPERLAGKAALPSASVSRALWRAIEEQLLFAPGKQPVALPYLVRGHALPILRERTRELFRSSRGHSVANNLTGIALVMTFGLLGFVLIGPVFEALQESASESSQAASLSSAISQMGAKFFVSAMGLLLSMVLRGAASRMESGLMSRLDELRASFDAHTETLDARRERHAEGRENFQAQLREELARQHHRMADELKSSTHEVTARLKDLSNINVSLQDIGTNVTSSMSSMMKNELGQLLAAQLGRMEQRVHTIAEEMQKALADSFTNALTEGLKDMGEHLEAIRKEVAGRGESDLEKLIHQLKDAVSGSFSSQSEDMARQLAQVAQVLPNIERQFSAMSAAMGENAKQWGAENQRAVEQLAEKVSLLVGSFESVQGGLEEAVSRVMQATVDSSTRVGEVNQRSIEHLSQQVGEVIGGFHGLREGLDASVQALHTTSQQMAAEIQGQAKQGAGAVNHGLEQLRSAAALEADSFAARSRTFNESMGKAHQELGAMTRALGDVSTQLINATKGTGQAQDATRAAGLQLSEVAKRLATAGDTMGLLAEKREAVVEREEELIAAQRVALEHMNPIMVELAQTYEAAVKKQTELVANHWMSVTRNLDTALKASSQEFAEGVDELNASVRELKSVLKASGGRV